MKVVVRIGVSEMGKDENRHVTAIVRSSHVVMMYENLGILKIFWNAMIETWCSKKHLLPKFSYITITWQIPKIRHDDSVCVWGHPQNKVTPFKTHLVLTSNLPNSPFPFPTTS